MTGPQVAAAQEAYEAGLCVVPPREDGSKAPIGEWKQYQYERPDRVQMNTWYGGPNPVKGVGVVPGEVSGHVEMVEMEGAALTDGFYAVLLERLAEAELVGLWQRIVTGYTESTPSGGFHCLLRTEEAADSQKLATRPKTLAEFDASLNEAQIEKYEAKPEERERDFLKATVLLAETKGEGGFTICAPSNGSVHPEGRAWSIVSGGFSSIATITCAERDALYEAFRSLTETRPASKPTSVKLTPTATFDGAQPGDGYNADPHAHANVVRLMEGHGWTVSEVVDGVTHMTRPGKDEGTSATVGFYDNPPMLHVFTSSSGDFDADETYSPFGVYAILEHAGNHPAAARQLRRDGYGDTRYSSVEARLVADDDSPAPIYAPIDWAEFWAGDHHLEWVIEPVLPKGRLVAMFAKGKAGKSLLTLEWAAALATGREVLWRDTRKPIHVVYIDAEMTEGDIQDRLIDLGYSEDDDLSHLHYYLLQTMPPLDTEAGGDAIMGIAEEHDAEVVIVDTVSRVISGGENEADTFINLYRHTGMRLKAAGITFLRLDHSGKDDKKGQRGSSAKEQDADIVWRLADQGFKIGGSHRIALTVEASRMQLPHQTVNLDRKAAPLRHELVGGKTISQGAVDVLKLIDGLGLPADVGRDRARKAIKDAGMTASNNHLTEALRWRKRQVGQVDGQVKRTGQSDRFGQVPAEPAEDVAPIEKTQVGQVDGQVSTDLSDICPSLRDGQVEVDSSEMTCPSCGTPPKAIYPSGLCGDCDAAEVAQ